MIIDHHHYYYTYYNTYHTYYNNQYFTCHQYYNYDYTQHHYSGSDNNNGCLVVQRPNAGHGAGGNGGEGLGQIGS